MMKDARACKRRLKVGILLLLCLLLLPETMRADFQIGTIVLDEVDEVSGVLLIPGQKYAVIAM